MDRLLIATLSGSEDVVEDELRTDFGLPASVLAPGRIVVALPAGHELGATVRGLNRWSRCPDRVGILLLDRRGAVDLPAIEELAGAVAYGELVPRGRSFAVRATRAGSQPFRSPDVARAVGTAVNRVLARERGAAGRVDLDDPDVVVRADLQDDRLLVWLDTTGDDPLHVRRYRRYAHMASMRPTVANLLLRLSGWRGEPLVDPFCGSATILIEALLRARGIAPGEQRGRGWAWQRLEWLTAGGDAIRPRASAGAVDGAVFLGIERFASHLQGARENAGLAGVADDLRLCEGRAQRTDRIASRSSLDLSGGTVVTNPPFGRRVGSVAALAGLYSGASRAWRRAGIERVATIAEHADPMRRALRDAGYPIVRELPVIYGSTPVTLFVAGRVGD